MTIRDILAGLAIAITFVAAFYIMKGIGI